MPRLRAYGGLRDLRMKIRSGWVKEAPPEYYHMIRNPPLPIQENLKEKPKMSIPYIKYIQNARVRNPKYGAENLLHAFWQDEPLALILAKKQYELVKNGMDEEAAYRQAEKYAEKFEQSAYDDLVAVNEKLSSAGAMTSFTADKELAAEIAKWKRILSKHPYEKLSDADQGEIDFMIQSKILKWGQVERDRRLADPIFVEQFEKLREKIFPEVLIPRINAFEGGREAHKQQQLNLLGVVSPAMLQTAAPFYYEDYVHYFNRLRDQPYLGKWTERNREKLSRWIIDTLAMKAKLEDKTRVEMQTYLDSVRAQFFPMVREPHRVKEFKLPSVDEVRAVLYNNDVGYKTEDSKLYVFRSYRLPMLLFPKETLTTIFTADHKKLHNVVKDENYLLKEMEQVGLDRARLDDFRAELVEYYNVNVAPITDSGTSSDAGIDMSIIDDLLRDDVEDQKQSAAAPLDNNRFPVTAEEEAEDDDEDEDDEAAEDVDEEDSAPLDPEDMPIRDSSVLADLRDKYKLVADSALETARIRKHEETEHFDWRTANTEGAMETIFEGRMRQDVILRARCTLSYERKEAARRARDWKRRKLVRPQALAVDADLPEAH